MNKFWNDMKTLYLPLKKEWYEMIEHGEKTEEYREIKPYWIRRFCLTLTEVPFRYCIVARCCAECVHDAYEGDFALRNYDAVRFSYGYTRRTMTFEVKSITTGKGRKEWGAPDEIVFIIKLGKRL